MKVLIIDQLAEEFVQDLENLPVEFDYLPHIQSEEVGPILGSYDILVLNSKVRIEKELLDQGPKLNLILRAGIGMDHFDLEACQEKGVIAQNTPGCNANAVGEQTVGMLLSLAHNIHTSDQEVRNFQWIRQKNRGNEIGDKTIGLIGYGNTGQSVAKKLSGFGCRTIAYDKYKTGYGDAFAEEVSLQELMAQSDVISFHVPLTEETYHWGNDAFFQKVSKPFVLLNLARGPVVKIPDLIRALNSVKILGAGLDVLENEELETLSPTERQDYEDLFQRKNVVLTPHIGGWSIQSRQNIRHQLTEAIKTHIVMK